MDKQFRFDGKTFRFSFSQPTEIDFQPLEPRNGVRYYRINFSWSATVHPEKITLEWETPAVNAYYTWDPLEKVRSLPFFNRATQSRVAYGMPIKALVSKTSRNACTIALSDPETPLTLNMRCDCTSGCIHYGAEFFTMQTGPFDEYQTVLRIDERDLPFDEAIPDAAEWIREQKSGSVPSAAIAPMYSTWYSYMQNVTAEKVIEECRKAAEFGMKTVILDDGWQIEHSDGAYSFCGDWTPSKSKFPDMKAFTSAVHALGMKVMLWFAVPFIGKNAAVYPEFQGKYLCDLPDLGCSVLDPRFPSVRKFLTDTYVNAVKNYNLDGLKLDFIDRFKTNGTVPVGTDYRSVEQAVTALLEETYSALEKIKPGIMLEFRQPYFGTVVSAFGNMIRVWDCPLDSNTNMTQTINLRLISRNCAVHSDMIYWHENDSLENVACSLWGTVFAVPQISARLNSITPEQSRVLKRFSDYRTQNAALLTFGKIRTRLCENGYDATEVLDNNLRICLLSASPVITLDRHARTDAVNLTNERQIIVRNAENEPLDIAVYDCFGNLTLSENSAAALLSLPVPFAGMISVNKNN